MAKTHTPGLRRFTEHEKLSPHSQLDLMHPAAVEGGTRYKKRVTEPKDMQRLLKSGMNNKKIGKTVMKGRWKGMPIYTLTLEERATCPRTCHHWYDCYGNKMNWAKRIKHGQELELRLEYELGALAEIHPKGFVVRLHVLGDFYSVEYVKLWGKFLEEIPQLHVYGYTARARTTGIGNAIQKLNYGDPVRREHKAKGRCYIRTSFSARGISAAGEGPVGTGAAVTVYPGGDTAKGIVCPAQQDQTECCATCTLCWEAWDKTIIFKAH